MPGRTAAERTYSSHLPMTLRVFNTLTRQTEVFVPIEPNHVRMYVCGITIYDFSHVGHARMMIAFDVIYGWLRTLGYGPDAWRRSSRR